MFKKKVEDMISTDMETMIHWLATINKEGLFITTQTEYKMNFCPKGHYTKTLDLQDLTDNDFEMDM